MTGMNRARPEQREIAETEMNCFVLKGYVAKFDSYDDVVDFLDGERPVLSHLRVVSKLRYGVMKHRLVFDARESGITSASTNVERVLLPRVHDVVADSMSLWKDKSEFEFIRFLVLDFENAFWQIPISVQERKFFVTRVNHRYYVLLRAAQGSRTAPLLWARDYCTGYEAYTGCPWNSKIKALLLRG